MEEYHQITLDEWTQWKEDIRRKLAETAQNFVYIGYRLKQIRDSGMYGGSSDIFEFAQKEYGLGKSTVSRFIAINEKYSEDGNSLELKEQYRGFSSSKLAEMLSLPDSECELITEKTTIKDIRELKNFDKQQPEDVQPAPPETAAGHSPLQACIIDYFKDKKEMLGEVLRHILDKDLKAAAMSMNPSECSTHSKGICFLFMYNFDKGVKYKLLMQPEPFSLSWEEFLTEHLFSIYREMIPDTTPEGVYEAFYKDAVATSQQKNTDVEGDVHQETLIKPDSEEGESPQTQKPQLLEPVGKNESAENKPFSEMEKPANPATASPETCFEKPQIAESGINTEKEDTPKTANPVTASPETVATSQQNEAFMNLPKEAHQSEDPLPESVNPESCMKPQSGAVATSGQNEELISSSKEEAGSLKDSGEHSEDRFIRRGQMMERLEKLQRALNHQEWEYALDVNKHLGWDIEWMINN